MISILIVEDYRATRAALRRSLVNLFDHDAMVMVAATAGEAISLLQGVRFDVVVSDLRLGETSGADVLAYVRASLPDLVERFVFFTSDPGTAAKLHHKVISKDDAVLFASRFVDLMGELLPSVNVEVEASPNVEESSEEP